MTNKGVYSKEESVQDINNRYLETIKQTVRDALKNIPEKDQLEALIGDDATFRIFNEFEGCYRIIFGSQIELLLELYKKNEYMPKYDVKKLFDEQMVKRKIDFDVDFDKWLGFLTAQGLVQAETVKSDLASLLLANETYRITDKGIAFLTFMMNRNYDPKNIGL